MDKDKMIITVLSFITMAILVMGTLFYFNTIKPLQEGLPTDNPTDEPTDNPNILTPDQIAEARKNAFKKYLADLVSTVNTKYEADLVSDSPRTPDILLNGQTEASAICYNLGELVEIPGDYTGHVIMELSPGAEPAIYFYISNLSLSVKYMTPAAIAAADSFSPAATETISTCPTGQLSFNNEETQSDNPIEETDQTP